MIEKATLYLSQFSQHQAKQLVFDAFEGKEMFEDFNYFDATVFGMIFHLKSLQFPIGENKDGSTRFIDDEFIIEQVKALVNHRNAIEY